MTETAYEGPNSGGTDVVTILAEDHREMLELLAERRPHSTRRSAAISPMRRSPR